MTRIPYLSALIRSKLRMLDTDIKNEGLAGAMKLLAKRNNTKLNIVCEKNTANIIKIKPVLVIANHPYEAETLMLLASLPKRKDIFMVISELFLNLAPHADRYFIPIFGSHHAQTDGHKKLLTRIVDKVRPPSMYPKKEAQEKNKKSIRNAALKLDDGGIVIMYPMGGRGKKGKWFDGVGNIIKQVEKKDEVYVVFAYINGSSHFDYLRLLPGIRRIFSSIYIYFAKPQKLSSLTGNQLSAREIKDRLEADYNDWVSTVQQK